MRQGRVYSVQPHIIIQIMSYKLRVLLICYFGFLNLTNGQSVYLFPNENIVKKFINDSYFVSCTLSDDSTSAIWVNPRGQILHSSPQSRIRVDISHGVDLFLNGITTDDEGLYSCISPKGNRASFNLSVIRPIVFETSLAEQEAPEGQTYTMKCRAQGQSRPKIIWKVDQRNPPKPKYKIMRDGLMIHNVSQHDAYRQYMCRAMDMDSPIPDTKVMNITLKVITPTTAPWEITDTAANVHPSSVVAVLCNFVILQFLTSLL